MKGDPHFIEGKYIRRVQIFTQLWGRLISYEEISCLHKNKLIIFKPVNLFKRMFPLQQTKCLLQWNQSVRRKNKEIHTWIFVCCNGIGFVCRIFFQQTRSIPLQQTKMQVCISFFFAKLSYSTRANIFFAVIESAP